MAQSETVRRAGVAGVVANIDEGLRAHMNKVYGLMSVAMVITGAAAWALAGLATTTDPSAAVAQVSATKYLTQFGYTLYVSPLKWVVMFAPLAMVFLFSAMINRLSAPAAQLFFYTFAVLMGASISSIFLVYTAFSITQVFLITAIAFASLSLWGYTTKRDISGWGSFLFMGLIGIIVAAIVNIFLQSDAMAFAISAIGVLVFAGLTAYDTQNIKNTYVQMAHHGQTEWLEKSAIMGALNLYLNFINMFIMLLSLFGSRE